jgi:hypothetical protein
MIDNGWGGDHVGMLHDLQSAVRILLEGSDTVSKRLERTSFVLIKYQERDFPERLRNRAKRLLEFRGMYVRHVGHYSYLERVTPTDKKNFCEDLKNLYEACLIDLGRSWPQWDFMYPKDIEFSKVRSA